MADPTAPEKARPISLRLDAETLTAIDGALGDGEDRTTWIRGAIHSALKSTGDQAAFFATLPSRLGGRQVPALARSTRARLRR